MKKPRSWAEAERHPGINSIEHEKPVGPLDNDANHLVILEDGWSFNEDMTISYVANLRDLQSMWHDIVNLPSANE
jgi:hypothetical protein